MLNLKADNVEIIDETNDPKKIGEAFEKRKEGIKKMLPLSKGTPLRGFLKGAKKQLKDVDGPVPKAKADEMNGKLDKQLKPIVNKKKNKDFDQFWLI